MAYLALVLIVALVTQCTASQDDAPELQPADPAGVGTPMDAASVGPDTLVELDAATGELVRVVAVGPDPLIAVPATDSVWTLNLDDSTVTRVDAGTGAASTPEVGEAVGIASDGANVWVATDGRLLTQVEGTTGVRLRSIPKRAGCSRLAMRASSW